jgi:hypothetical protein
MFDKFKNEEGGEMVEERSESTNTEESSFTAESTSQIGIGELMDETTNAESESILKEAAAVAETSAGQMFPSVPTDTQEATTSKYL